jgi:hypothetical protein
MDAGEDDGGWAIAERQEVGKDFLGEGNEGCGRFDLCFDRLPWSAESTPPDAK